MSTGFSDAALLLIGHGATMNRESAAPVYQHATALRARHLFAEVREAFRFAEDSDFPRPEDAFAHVYRDN